MTLLEKKINMASPYFCDEDRKLIHGELDSILSNTLSMGPNVARFEKAFSEKIGVEHSIAMNSCTSALEAVLQYIGVAGHEVIVPSQTFIATGMAVYLSGGTPVFAEISDKTFCLDLEDVKRRVTKKTVAIILVHMAGLLTPDILEFRDFCDNHGLFLIEDAAHTPGAQLQGRQAGSFGHAGCFSFYSTKILAAGEGGMVTTNNSEIANFARSYQLRGRDLNSKSELYIMPGRNVRMTELTALLGWTQLGHLDDFLIRRRRVASIYLKQLADINNLKIIMPRELTSSSFWKVPVLLDSSLDRDLIIDLMSKVGISIDSAYNPPMHLQPVFRQLYGNLEGLLPKTEKILSTHICLPCHSQMSDEDALRVCAELKKSMALAVKRD